MNNTIKVLFYFNTCIHMLFLYIVYTYYQCAILPNRFQVTT